MGRATYGTGYVVRRGKKWYGYPRIWKKNPISGEKGVSRKPFILGSTSGMTKKQAREELAREVAKLTGRFTSNGRMMNDGSVSFSWFVRNRYYPLKEGDWREETATTKKSVIQTNLLDELGAIPLENFDRFTLQLHVNKLGKNKPKDTVLQMRAYLRDIFAEATDQEFLYKDPALRVKVPANLRERDATILTWDQLCAALEDLPVNDRLTMELDMTEALRPSELFAVKWRCWNRVTSLINLQETAYKGKIRPFGKTKASLAPLHVPENLADDIERWKKVCPDSSPDAYMFPNGSGGLQDTDNYRKRVLHALAERLGFTKLTFQVIRRTIATLALPEGSPKDVQGLLRHLQVSTSLNVYTQIIREGVVSTINAVSRKLRKEPVVKRSKAARFSS